MTKGRGLLPGPRLGGFVPLHLGLYGPVNEAVHTLTADRCVGFYGLLLALGHSYVYSVIVGFDVFVYCTLICF